MKNREGEKFITNEGYIIEVIEYFKYENCTIQFEDGTVVKNKRYDHLLDKRIKNPHHKSIFRVGYYGVGKYSQKIHPKIYRTWYCMFQRCYDKNYQEKQPTYAGCSVAEQWHNFQVFAEWYEESWKPWMDKTWQLDKDILIKGNKVYSPETCAFVPQEINKLFKMSQKRIVVYPTGIDKHSKKFRVRLGKNKYYGVFDTIEEAFEVYKKLKENRIKEITEKYKDKITEQIYQVLINYKI